MTTTDRQETESTQVEGFAERLFDASLQAMELIDIVLGLRLGLYPVLAANPAVTSGEFARAAGIGERYAREWLEQQAVSGILDVDDPDAEAMARRYTLPPARAHVLLERDSEAYLAPFVEAIAIVPQWLDRLESAYRTGAGIPYEDFAVHDIQAAMTRPIFKNQLVQTWLPALPDVHAKLSAGTARIAEIGCGEGVAAVEIAKAFPGVRVDGFDPDPASIDAARQTAAEEGVADRVRFEVRTAEEIENPERYDLVYCVEMLHDVSDPVGVLRAMRGLRGDDGTVLVVDERAAERFQIPADPMERLFYAFSTVHCLPAGLAHQPSAATGTVIRPGTVRRYATDAGFTAVEELPVEHPQFRLYRLEG